MSFHGSLGRLIARRTPFVASTIGVVIVLGSVMTILMPYDWPRIVATAIGTLFFVIATWYAAHPYMTNERRNPRLRSDVDDFILLVREMHRAALADDAKHLDRVVAEMHEAVELMRDHAHHNAQTTPRFSPAGQPIGQA